MKNYTDKEIQKLPWRGSTKTMECKVNLRQEANREILKLLSSLVEKYPEQRFHQIMANAGAVIGMLETAGIRKVLKDEYSAESIDVLQRMKNEPFCKK